MVQTVSVVLMLIFALFVGGVALDAVRRSKNRSRE